MTKDYFQDLALYIWIRALNKFFSSLPLSLSLAIGKAIARFVYLFPTDRKKTAYKNIRLSLCDRYNPKQLKIILKKTYDNWGMNFIEAVMLSRMSSDYLSRYVEAEGLDRVRTMLDQNKGLVMMGSHFGSWEILHIGIPQKGKFDFYILARPQKLKMAADYLDKLRRKNNCFVLYKGMGSREAISVLKEHKAFGLVVDQGGRTEDAFVKFFGRLTPTPTGVVRFALKFDAPIVAGYIKRIRGPYHKITMLKPYYLERKPTTEETISYNLEKLNQILEGYVKDHPSEYFWFHKRWKYSQDKNILVLTDGKAGHLRQLEAFLKEYKKVFNQRGKGFSLDIKTVEIKFKSNFRKFILKLHTFLFANIFDCLNILEYALKKECYRELTNKFFDVVVSAGSMTHASNLLIAKENYARSAVIMNPGIFLNRFNIAIVPSHDKIRQKKNVFITKGSLNLVDRLYLDEQKTLLINRLGYKDKGLIKIGILIGGDAKNKSFSAEVIEILIKQINELQKELGIELFITTSRRTSFSIEARLKTEFVNNEVCKLLVIANDNNMPEAIGGILGLSDIVIVSGDSISMVSEAASSSKYVIVFKLNQKNTLQKSKYDLFLNELSGQGYIQLIDVQDLNKSVKGIFYNRPKINILNNSLALRSAIERLF